MKYLYFRFCTYTLVVWLTIIVLWLSACDRTIQEDIPPPKTDKLMVKDIPVLTSVNVSIHLPLYPMDLVISRSAIMHVENPKNGKLSIDHEGIMYRYRPAFNYVGKDSLRYTICEEGECKSAMIYIDVKFAGNEISRPPCELVPNPDQAVVVQGDSVTIAILDNDILSCDIVQLDITTSPANGRARTDWDVIVYKPARGFSGLDSLAYTLCGDRRRVCSKAWVKIDVIPGNEPPIPPGGPGRFIERSK